MPTSPALAAHRPVGNPPSSGSADWSRCWAGCRRPALSDLTDFRDELAARARAYVHVRFTADEREQALLTADLERYFLARTGDADPKEL